jgi:drug/metabolite transporter (DMT)-like permease
MVHVGLLLALGCALTAQVALLCKHRGAIAAPSVDIRHPLRSVAGLFGARWFAIGFAIAVGAWALQVAAMSLAPLSLVKAVIAGSLALLVVPAQRWFGHRIGKRELIGLGLSGIGLALLAITMHNAATDAHSDYSTSAMIAFESGAIVFGLTLILSGRHQRAVEHSGILLGAAAGVMLGVADVSVKALTGTVPGDPMSLLGPWTLVALVGAVGAFFALARGLQVGGAIQVIALSTIASNVAAVLGGIIVFGDPVGGDVLAITGRVVAFAAVIGAAALMPSPGAPRTPAPAPTVA